MDNLVPFEEKQVRRLWNEADQKWYFAIVDVVGVLTESVDSGAYWRKLKERLKKEGNETVTNCHAFKMTAADGKQRITDLADAEQLLRLIQSVPSPKAEYAILTAEISKATFGMTPTEYRKHKALNHTGDNLRDHMTDLELIFTMLGEASTTEIARNTDAEGFPKNKHAAKAGGKVAGNARKELERKSGRKVSTSENFK
jgi:hypothetical protein